MTTATVALPACAEVPGLINGLGIGGGRAMPGLETPELPTLPLIDENTKLGQALTSARRASAATEAAANAEFENGELLATLRARTEEKREARRAQMEERNCLRQAELGVGDCGGLRLIPGATKSGKQVAPEWLESLVLGGE